MPAKAGIQNRPAADAFQTLDSGVRRNDVSVYCRNMSGDHKPDDKTKAQEI